MTPEEALRRVIHGLDRALASGFKTKAFVRAPDGISIELLQDGHLEPAEPWASMPNTGEW